MKRKTPNCPNCGRADWAIDSLEDYIEATAESNEKGDARPERAMICRNCGVQLRALTTTILRIPGGEGDLPPG